MDELVRLLPDRALLLRRDRQEADEVADLHFREPLRHGDALEFPPVDLADDERPDVPEEFLVGRLSVDDELSVGRAERQDGDALDETGQRARRRFGGLLHERMSRRIEAEILDRRLRAAQRVAERGQLLGRHGMLGLRGGQAALEVPRLVGLLNDVDGLQGLAGEEAVPEVGVDVAALHGLDERAQDGLHGRRLERAEDRDGFDQPLVRSASVRSGCWRS